MRCKIFIVCRKQFRRKSKLLKEIFFEQCDSPRQTISLHIALILISVAFISIYSTTTSFLYPYVGGDSAVFQVLGKYWLEGFLPYKDLFDHKGPLLFFINAIGWTIHPREGIMISQIIFMYLSLLLIWRMLDLYFDSLRLKILCFSLPLIYFISRYVGNNASEYSVVFVSAAAYCFMLSLKTSATPLDLQFYLWFWIRCLRVTSNDKRHADMLFRDSISDLFDSEESV